MQRISIWCFFLLSSQLFSVTTAVRDFPLPSKFDSYNFESIKTFTALRNKHNPINLGVGVPDFNPPNNLKQALAQAALSDELILSQYGPINGHPRLLNAVAKFFSQRLNRTLKAENVLITIGGTQALYSIFQAFSEPKDEWIVFIPAYHVFAPMIKAAGAIPKFVPLRPKKSGANVTAGDFTFDHNELRGAFNAKTKGIIVNSPHNPLGKMFTKEEMKVIAELANEWDVIAVFDEVYQFFNFDGSEHIRLPTFPGMFDRTIAIGSVGKMFSATGYRVGWIYGPKKLVDNVLFVQNMVVLTTPQTLHVAVAELLEDETVNYGKPTSYLSTLRRDSEEKRNYLYKIFSNVGMKPILPQGGYFTVADWTTMINPSQLYMEVDEYMDFRFVKWLVKNVGIYALPLTLEYGENHKKWGEHFVRIAMIKTNETLQEVEKRLLNWKENATIKNE